MKMTLSKSVRRKIELHALEQYVSGPRECCGLVVGDGNRQAYFECKNIAQNPNTFAIDPKDWACAEDTGQILAIVHSHVDHSASPSELDRLSCEEHKVPWHIVAVGQDAGAAAPRVLDWCSFEPSGYVVPLVGRTFHHGTLDCYGLIRDFFEREVSILLPNFERSDLWWEEPDAEELYLNNFKKAGFRRVEDGPRYGDVILMQYHSDKTNHGAVFLGASELKSQPGLPIIPGAMLHHAMPRLSERVMYGGHWRESTRMIVRHKELS